MALNTAVDDGEIGRAQAGQACHIETHTEMNPLLLKPNSDTGVRMITHVLNQKTGRLISTISNFSN